jgi:hypothetical protein
MKRKKILAPQNGSTFVCGGHVHGRLSQIPHIKFQGRP